MTPALVIEKHAANAGAAAIEIVRRFQGTDDFARAAHLWCDRFGGQAHELGNGRDGVHSEARCVHGLLVEALRDHVPLESWTSQARRTEFLRGVRREVEAFDIPLLHVLLVAWPQRDDLEAMLVALRAWASGESGLHAAYAARALCEYPDVAYALLGPPNYVPPVGPCTGCGKHPRDLRETGYFHLALVLERRRRQCPSDLRDDQVLNAIPAEALLHEPFLLALIRGWLREGREAPTEQLWLAVEQAVVARDAEWWNAVSVLVSGSEEQQRRAVQLLTEVVRTSDEPGRVLAHLLGRDRLISPHLFSGRGWGRKPRRHRLRDLARAFLERRVWPTLDWLHCVEQDEPAGESEEECAKRLEARHEAVREILAEGLLSFALDERVSDAIRYCTIEAIEKLQPGGDGSWAEALSKVQGRGLEERARAVRRALSHTRLRVDAELGIEDALATFFESGTGAQFPCTETKPRKSRILP